MKKNYLLVFVCSALLWSCGNNQQANVDIDSMDTSMDSGDKTLVDVVPTPLETAMFIKSTGVAFDESLINSPQNVSHYTSSTAKALNMGIYSVDLSYSCFFDASQTSISLLNVNRKLIDELGIASEVDPAMIKQFEENINDKHFIVNMLSDFYMNTDAHMIYGNNPKLGSLIIAGGWIEALFLTTQLRDKLKDKTRITQRIIDQKITLESVFNMLQVYKNNDEIKDIATDFVQLKSVFDKIIVGESKSVAVKDTVTGKTLIKTQSQTHYTEEIMTELRDQTATLRNKYVKP